MLGIDTLKHLSQQSFRLEKVQFVPRTNWLSWLLGSVLARHERFIRRAEAAGQLPLSQCVLMGQGLLLGRFPGCP